MPSKIIFLRGSKVILRPLNSKTDLDKCLKWINNPELRVWINVSRPISREQEETWFKQEKQDEIRLAICTTDQNIYIGNIALCQIDFINRTAVTGTMIGEKRY